MSPHRHLPGEPHAPARVAPSILRLSAGARLAASAVVIAGLWAAVYWAVS